MLLLQKQQAMIRIFLHLIPLAVIYSNVLGQNVPIRISVFNESTSMPFTRAFSIPIHPGVELGTEFTWHQSKHFKIYPTVTLGYVFHKNLYQAIFINGALGIDYRIKFGLNIKTALGIGYMRSFRTQQEYDFDGGSYHKKHDRGNGRVAPSLSLGLGYSLHPSRPHSSEIFIMYQTWIEYPYSPGFIPIMTHTNVHIGYKFYPFQSETN
jgi:hypothetical protein